MFMWFVISKPHTFYWQQQNCCNSFFFCCRCYANKFHENEQESEGKENHGDKYQPQHVNQWKMLLISKQRELNAKEKFSVTVTDEELADFSKALYYLVTVTSPTSALIKTINQKDEMIDVTDIIKLRLS